MVTGALILAVFAMVLAGLPEHSGVRGYVRNYAICYAVLIGLVTAGVVIAAVIRTGLCAGYLITDCY